MIALTFFLAHGTATAAPVSGWLSARGPFQNGSSLEKGLPDSVATKAALWTADFPGQSTPVIANGKLYITGYLGAGQELQEGVACFDAESGQKLWQQLYSDFLSDIIYTRYATSSPVIDPETGNVFLQGTQGMLTAFTPDGKKLWQHSLMESLGRLTFPNGRTASPAVDGDLLIVRGIMANWGAQGPAADRFYAFDKKTGELVWASTPGDRPKDNSYSSPYFMFHGGRRVFIAANGDGSVTCANARTGEPIWRVPLFRAGINATTIVHNNDKVIAVFGTPYEPGQMVAMKLPSIVPSSPTNAPVVIDRATVELWSNELSTSASHPILVGDRLYLVAEKGDLACVDVNTGKVLWKIKLGIEQRNASLIAADGKLYVPILDNPAGDKVESGSETGTKGGFYIIQPSDKEGKILSHIELDGRCFGTPVAYNGKVYVQTTKKIYCFGKKGNNPGLATVTAEKWPVAGKPAQLQMVPSEVLLKPGEKAAFRVRQLDANGFTVGEVKDTAAVKWVSYIPPTARVRATMKGAFNADGQLVAAADLTPSAGAFMADYQGLTGVIRGRVLPGLPLKQDFESFQITEKHETEPDTLFAYPPLPWIGARFKFEVREKDGTKVLAKTIDNKFFQRGSVFLGESTMKNYTVMVDVMTDGNRRKMSDAGIINQRYYIVLKGNEQKLEINSNQERLRVPAADEPSNFKWTPNTWYRLKSRVDVNPDGSGVVRAKAWKRDEPEPTAWVLEVPVKHAHATGSPGLYGFAPQEMRLFIDNILVTPN